MNRKTFCKLLEAFESYVGITNDWFDLTPYEKRILKRAHQKEFLDCLRTYKVFIK